MAKAPDKGIKLDEGKSILGVGNQKQVERLLKKAADQATKAAKRRWKRSGGNPFSNHAHARMGGIERALTNALAGALTFHSNNSGQRPSIRMTAPDTGGRPFHFDHTAVSSQTIKLKPGETAKAVRKSGKFEARPKRHTSSSGAHMAYLERDGAAERIEVDLEAAANLRAEIEGMGRELTPGAMQAYVEDPSKAEDPKRATEGKPPTALVFSYGTPDMGDTLEERMAFWDLAEEHAKGESGTIQHRLIMELPHEATPEDRLAIMKAFTAKFDEDKIPYHVVLHAPTSKNDDRNYHAHVVMLNRPAVMIDWPLGGKVKIGPEGPIRKTWDFAAKSFLPDDFRVTKWRYPKREKVLDGYRATFVKDQRKRFSDVVNERMAAVGNPVRYDHRSYKAMGLEVDAMKSISRIIKDKAKAGDRVVLDYAQTKRDVEAEIQRLARERAPDFAEVSKIRAAVRAGDRELRQLEKEGAFLKKKPILRRGAHAVKTYVKRKALDYARTRALHVERSIEAAQEIRSVERIIEATNPEVIAQLRAKLARSLIQARAKGNKNEVARLKKEMDVVPKVSHASLLNKVAREEVEQLRTRHQRQSVMRFAKVRQALREWREAALGAKPDMTPAVRAEAGRVGGIEIGSQPITAPTAAKPAPPREPPPNSYDEMIDQVFKTPFHRYMWDVTKRYSQFIMDNVDPNVPGRTAVDLTNKLVEAIKIHPVKADELIMSYRLGNPDAGPSNVPAWKPPERRADTPEAAPQPVFKQKARMPVPEPDEVMPYPRDLGVPEHKPPIIAEPRAPEPRRKVEKAEEPVVPQIPLADREAETPLKPRPKERDKRKKRQKAILAQRVMER